MINILSVLFVLFMSGCCDKQCLADRRVLGAEGGGHDSVTINMPFPEGDSYRCTQGTYGSYSHTGTSTRYDIDFDTPNDVDEIVYAPVGGIAYVHDSDPYTNFGYHVNIDMDDGTYIIMAHLSSIFVENGSEVAAGQIVGFEGTTGASTGDHLHIGRHDGDAAEDGIYGESIEGLEISASNATLGSSVASIAVSDFTCSLTSGHFYTSVLPVPLWHPNGTLMKTPGESTVYLMEEGVARPFITEASFLTRNYNFADVVLISDYELTCVGEGEGITTESDVVAVYDDDGSGGVWLLHGTESASDRFRQRVSATGWQGVLKSWGINASTYDDLPQNSELDDILSSYSTTSASTASYRNGALVSPSDASDVYFMSDGVAMPIETWSTFLLAGFANRTVLEVERSELESVASVRGSCSTDTYCLTERDLTTCGGPDAESEGTFTAAAGTSEDESETDEESAEESPEEEPEDEPAKEEPEDADEGEPNELTLTWSTPGGARASRITLSGEYTPYGGSPLGWTSSLAETTDASSLSYTRSMAEGDNLRFSVEYVIGSSTSWSCLAPFPSGTVQGTPAATWNGTLQDIGAVADPSSSGCGLSLTVE